MLLAADVGNTNVKLGIFDGDNLKFKLRFSTDENKTSDELAVELYTFLQIYNIDAKNIDGAIISGVSPEVFKHADERATNSLLYSLSVGLYNYGNNFSSVGDLPVNDRLYILQHKIIKQLAEKENFVVVGRCADYVLKDNPKLVKVYIYADLDKRIKRAVDRQDIDPARAKQAVLKADKNRANYYSFYSGKKWGLADNYDLCLNSTNITVDQAVDIIISYINICDSNKK